MVQIPNRRRAFSSFEIEIWDLFGIWNLVFGISTPLGSGDTGLGRGSFEKYSGCSIANVQ